MQTSIQKKKRKKEKKTLVDNTQNFKDFIYTNEILILKNQNFREAEISALVWQIYALMNSAPFIYIAASPEERPQLVCVYSTKANRI